MCQYHKSCRVVRQNMKLKTVINNSSGNDNNIFISTNDLQRRACQINVVFYSHVVVIYENVLFHRKQTAYEWNEKTGTDQDSALIVLERATRFGTVNTNAAAIVKRFQSRQ